MAEMVEFYGYNIGDKLNLFSDLKKGDLVFAKARNSEPLFYMPPLLGIYGGQSTEICFDEGNDSTNWIKLSKIVLFDELVLFETPCSQFKMNNIYYSLKISDKFKNLKKFLKKSKIDYSGGIERITCYGMGNQNHFSCDLNEIHKIEKNDYKKISSLLA